MQEFSVPKMSRLKVFFRPLSVKILSVIMVVLLIAIGCLSYSVINNNKRISSANATVDETEMLLEKANSEITELEKTIEHETDSNKKLKEKLNKLESQRDKLEKQVDELKKQSQSITTSKKKDSPVKKDKKYPSISVPLKNNGKKVCYLTFDDGPSKNTLKIIKILDKYGIKATFFVTEIGTTKYIKNIYESGNAIGLHTASHNYSKIYSSKSAYFKDLEKISSTVKKYTGADCKVIRFPGGSSNTVSNTYSKNIMKKLISAVNKKGYEYFDWNVDSCDASAGRASKDFIVRSVKNSVEKQKAICILMHDSASKTTTVDALPEIIEWLYKKGYRFEVLTTEVDGFKHLK